MTRHRVAGYQFSRDAEDRRALRRNLAIALFTHGQIETTIPKAKSVKGFIEKIITAARKGDLASRRRVISMLGHDSIIVKGDFDESVTRNKYGEITGGPKLVKKLFDEIAPKYATRPGGYTRIIKLAKHRIGDGTSLCVLQLVGDEEGPQVSGQFSRRRQKANYRVEFAAKAKKAQDAKTAGAAAPATPPAQA